MKVLIVEDNGPVAEATRLILTKNGWNTEHVIGPVLDTIRYAPYPQNFCVLQVCLRFEAANNHTNVKD